jgi:hypothetical protein
MARVGKVLSVIILGAAVGAAFQNCSQALPEEAQQVQQSQSPPEPVPLSIKAPSTDIAANATLQLTVAGGTPPYSVSVVTGSGTLDSSNLFTAPAVTEADVVEVTDANGGTAHITINVLAPLALSYTPTPATSIEKIKLVASGGRAPYTYQLLAGVGTLTGDEFTPTSVSAATTLVQVTDADGRTKQISIAVAMPASTALYALFEPSAGSRLLSTDPNAGNVYGYSSLGVAFRVLNAQVSNSAAINRCAFPGYSAYVMYNVYVVGSCPANYSLVGLIGYISTTARPNMVPLYGNSTYKTYLSRNASDLTGLGIAASVVGYVLP